MASQGGSMEHRWGQRKAVHKLVRVRTRAGVAAQGHITNMSISGAFVNTPLPVPLLSVIEVSFNGAPGKRRAVTVVEAQVVRKTAEGLGLEWCELAPAAGRAPDEIRDEIAARFRGDHLTGTAPGSKHAK
jgi:hypothetical protein